MCSSVEVGEKSFLSKTCRKDFAILAESDIAAGVDWLDHSTGFEGRFGVCSECHCRLSIVHVHLISRACEATFFGQPRSFGETDLPRHARACRVKSICLVELH